MEQLLELTFSNADLPACKGCLQRFSLTQTDFCRLCSSVNHIKKEKDRNTGKKGKMKMYLRVPFREPSSLCGLPVSGELARATSLAISSCFCLIWPTCVSLKTKLWGVCRGFVPDIQVCGTHKREDLVNATITSNAKEEEEATVFVCLFAFWLLALKQLKHVAVAIKREYSINNPSCCQMILQASLSKHQTTGVQRRISYSTLTSVEHLMSTLFVSSTHEEDRRRDEDEKEEKGEVKPGALWGGVA